MTGPVQVLVLGFEEPEFSGEVMAELNRLGDAGMARLLDVLLVSRTADGHRDAAGAAGRGPGLRSAGRCAPAARATTPARTASRTRTTWSLDDAVPATGAAAIALIEHTWAQPLVGAIRGAGGRLLDETWLAPDDLALLETLAGPE